MLTLQVILIPLICSSRDGPCGGSGGGAKPNIGGGGGAPYIGGGGGGGGGPSKKLTGFEGGTLLVGQHCASNCP